MTENLSSERPISLNPITDRCLWEGALRHLPNPHLLQSWDWGDFKSRWGWQPTRLLWSDCAGNPFAAAQILSRPIPHTPWRMLYVPKGPLWHDDNTALVEQVMSDLETQARKQRALFIKIDPDVILGFDPTLNEVNPGGQVIKSRLQARGWIYSDQQIQFQNTVLLEIEADEAALLAAMKSKWRYNIRLAQRKGVLVQSGGSADLEIFYHLYALTSQRDGFLIRPKAYYLDVWRQYLQAKQADLLMAQVDGQMIAGLILFYMRSKAWYMYGASSNQSRHLMPNHLLQWRAIQQAKARGCTLYDMWGAPTAFDPSDDMWGVYKFKLGFGGYTCQGLGAFDYPAWPWGYRFYRAVWPKLVALRRFGLG